MPRRRKADRILLFTITSILIIGLIVFFSASLGLLARDGARFGSVVSSQIGLGIIVGGITALIVSNIPYKKWGKYSFWMMLFAIALSLLVFVPGIGFEHGGARRWISIGNQTLQPAEFLKIAYVIYLSAWLSNVKKGVKTFSHGLLPFLIISGVSAIILLIQPDTGTTVIMLAAGVSIYFIAGADMKHVLATGLLGIVAIAILIISKPYILDRIKTFIDPSADALGSGYQIQQSLIAIGSGGITGRGFGQSLQKFNYLPEPIGDSIFSVAAEEFGFIGASLLIVLFLVLLIRGFQLGLKSKDTFGGLLMFGLVMLIVAQSFFNMGAMLGILPLSGLPLIFVSHGGTAMFFSLLSVGIMLNISRGIGK
jgi:cell division protein FtsW